MEEFKFKHNELWCEDLAVRDIAERYGTPVYVYSSNSIVDHCRHIEKSFGQIDHLSCYAVKANANPAILSVLANEGIGADVGSLGELYLALKAGFATETITYSGVGKRDDEIEFALRKDILSLNVESEEELEVVDAIANRLGQRARILLRVNFDIDTGGHPYVATGRQQNKFGVERSKTHDALTLAQNLQGIDVLGIHSHIGSQITDAETFIIAARRFVELVGELRTAGFSVQHLNFGGGFGVQYRDFVSHALLPIDAESSETGLSTVKLLEAVLPILEQTRCKLLIQPGRSIVAHAGILVTKVLYQKEHGSKKFIIVDAGMNDLIRPSLYQSYHQIVPLLVQDVKHEVVDVVGPLCESGDFFAIDRSLPKSARGDYLALLCTGAYGYVLASNYNARPRPPEVLVDGAHDECIRKRESIYQL